MIIIELSQRTQKAVEYESDGDTYTNQHAWNSSQWVGKRKRIVVKRRANRNHPNHSIIKIGQNTEKSPGDLRGLAVSQNPVKDQSLRVV